jgi:hypothetical protein
MPGLSRWLLWTSGVRRTAWAAAVVVACGPLAVAAEPEAAAKPLVMRPDNTVIVEQGDAYSAAYLQHYLLKCVAKHPQAAEYHLDAKATPAQRAASPGFPVVKVPLDKLPQDKNVILAAPYKSLPAGLLTDAERAKLEQSKRNTVLVKRVGNVVVLTKRDPDLWNLAPMRIFLDRGAGIRMYGPPGAEGVEWISMPKGDSFEVGDLHVFMEPFFAKGSFSTGGYQRTLEWQRMNTIVSEGVDLRAFHSVINFFAPDKYHATLPQLYPMAADGTRPKPTGVYWNPCLADPDLAAKTAMLTLREMMNPEKGAKPLYIAIGVQDSHYACKCPVCTKSLEENGGDAANVWYPFINRVAKQCQEEFPGLYITTYVYSNIRKPPTGMRIEPNVCVDIVIKAYNYIDEPVTHELANEALAWSEAGAKWTTHDWNFSGVTPRFFSRQEAALLQWGAQHGMLGIYTEWSGGQYVANLDGANYWVLYQLLSDPYQDTDFLWRRYCQDMFGAGWEPMYRFNDMFAQKHVVSDAFYKRADWPRQEACGFSAEDVAQQRTWLDEAIAATKDDAAVQQRLATVDRYFRAHELLVKAVSVPGRLYRRHVELGKRTDIDKEAVAFYVNDDASALFAFDEYYDTKRTLPPDNNAEDNASSLRFSYRNNYSRGLGAIIQAVRRQALDGFDPQKATRDTARGVAEKAVGIFRANLPEKRNEKRAAEVEKLMTKMLWVPRGESLPTFDGDLSDAQWSKASVLDGFTIADILVPSREGNETEGKIMRVGDHLVVGVVCRQEKGIWAETPADRFTGSAIYRESCCEFFVEPVRPAESRVGHAQYVVNSLGSFRGFGKSIDNRAGVECAVKQAADGKSYTIEAAFPLKVEGQYDFTQERLLEFNIQRSPFHAKTFNPKERIGWAPIFFTAQNADSRGLLILE